jgi:hypothetical protein
LAHDHAAFARGKLADGALSFGCARCAEQNKRHSQPTHGCKLRSNGNRRDQIDERRSFAVFSG